jgi:hypothetical protein
MDELQKLREYSVKRTHFNLNRIPLLPRLRARTITEWNALATKYPLGEPGYPAINNLRKRLLEKGLPGANLSDKRTLMHSDDVSQEGFVSHQAQRVTTNAPHVGTLIKKPFEEYHFFDPHGRPIEDEESSLKLLKGAFSRLPGKLTQCSMFGKFQTNRGTCFFWSILRQLHPEKTDEEFYQMVLDAQERTGLPPGIITLKDGREADENLDLIPIALFEQYLEEGSPELSVEQRMQHRTGLGKIRMTHRKNVLKRYNLPDDSYSKQDLSKVTKVPLKIIQEVYNRGIGAYETNPESVRIKGTFKKGPAPMSQKLSKEQWAMARVYSFLDGNPKHDTDLREKICAKCGLSK